MILFYAMAIVLILSAIFVVTAAKPVYSVVGLLAHFAALAILYFSLSAEFLGVIQIIVYSGAILMLFLFVIALLSSGVAAFSEGPNRLPKIAYPAAGALAVLLGFLVFAAGKFHAAVPAASKAAVPPVGAANAFGSVADFGRALFTVDLLPFEITAFILMVAVIGVILLAGDATPYVPVRKRQRIVDQEMREAVIREGRH
ncbi:MAG TPA: NADH-quinone oxidoreductase subunit J [Candidatus Baltobacteraceae bacterium]|nr:NADH-quinone oxidoreductase subunit J [Candidatus Baltobacteraceae bacterium]